MKHRFQTFSLVVIALVLQMMTTGCGFRGGGSSGGGIFGGIFDFFGGGGSDSSSSGDSGSSVLSQLAIEDLGGSLGEVAPAAVIHSPEPGSLILFGAGLAGAALCRRRKTRKRA